MSAELQDSGVEEDAARRTGTAESRVKDRQSKLAGGVIIMSRMCRYRSNVSVRRTNRDGPVDVNYSRMA